MKLSRWKPFTAGPFINFSLGRPPAVFLLLDRPFLARLLIQKIAGEKGTDGRRVCQLLIRTHLKSGERPPCLNF